MKKKEEKRKALREYNRLKKRESRGRMSGQAKRREHEKQNERYRAKREEKRKKDEGKREEPPIEECVSRGFKDSRYPRIQGSGFQTMKGLLNEASPRMLQLLRGDGHLKTTAEKERDFLNESIVSNMTGIELPVDSSAQGIKTAGGG